MGEVAEQERATGVITDGDCRARKGIPVQRPS